MCEWEILVSYKKMLINVKEYLKKNWFRFCLFLIFIILRDVIIFGGYVLWFFIV